MSGTRYIDCDMVIQSQDTTSEKPQLQLGSSQTGDEWEHCARILAQHSEEMVQRWKNGIDMLLVFVGLCIVHLESCELIVLEAGLISAVLTAFNMQSYQLLQPGEQGEMLAALAT